MNLPETLSLVLLVAVFALAIWRDVNVGLVALPAAFVLGAVAGIPRDRILEGFPAAIVILIIGVMYMFGHAQRSGAIDRLVHGVIRLSGGRDWALPWGMFLVGAVLSAIGTLPSATVAIILPIAMRLARNRDIDPVLMALVACSGAGVGGFSPLSPWGQIVHTLTAKAHVAYSPELLFAGLAVLKTVTTVIAFLCLGGIGLIRRGRTTPVVEDDTSADVAPAVRGAAPWTRYQIASLTGIGVFVVAVLAFGMNVVFVSLLVGLVLHLVFKPAPRRVVGEMPWGVILLTSGIMIYVANLEHAGTLEAISARLGGISAPVLAVLAVSYLAAFFATIESSTVAVLGVVVPLAAAALPGQTSTQFTMLLIAICGTIGTVAISPLHLGGGLVLANTEEAQTKRVFRWLLGWSVGAALVLPAALLVLPLAAGI
ncbi:SLC13 family permease [Actinomadura kijaniata]|uniref:Na+/H+ antiporter NhaD/arsenite permease-like protein n=1 Tax=Actinomadura namibiensis TaxID=182080 RepID=A0A7W3LXJ3_ACTNM|nr:SLC13 family permease [Actinomadura namibiensis]MBA8956164.1 Na+/H+ antiporter NhaD/arsenite permease-like protein [Actinomadura namibiensis]